MLVTKIYYTICGNLLVIFVQNGVLLRPNCKNKRLANFQIMIKTAEEAWFSNFFSKLTDQKNFRNHYLVSVLPHSNCFACWFEGTTASI